MHDIADLLDPILRIHDRLRDDVVAACERQSAADLARIERESEGDTIYHIDCIAEASLIELFEQEIAAQTPVVLIAEGLHAGSVVLPTGTAEAEAEYRVIVDPIDGTRVLMYQKRSGWILTGVAPNRGDATALQDIELAVQTEIPLVKQHLADRLWARRGQGLHAERVNRFTGDCEAFTPCPSHADTVAHGFAAVSRFYPGGRDVLADIDEEIMRGALGPREPGDTACFEDQYTSTAGQLYGLIMGHDRFVADLRPLLRPVLAGRHEPLGHCCHPYDLCTEMIAEEAGVPVRDAAGRPVNAPLDVTSDLHWIGYANERIRARMEPLLQAALRRRGMWPATVPGG
jgi:hypothetical protein